MITAEKAALFISCDFSQDWLVRNGNQYERTLATNAEWALVLNYVEVACRVRRHHLVEHSPHIIRSLHDREAALMGACEDMAVFQMLWEAVKKHYEAMDKEPTWFERVLESLMRRL